MNECKNPKCGFMWDEEDFPGHQGECCPMCGELDVDWYSVNRGEDV